MRTIPSARQIGAQQVGRLDVIFHYEDERSFTVCQTCVGLSQTAGGRHRVLAARRLVGYFHVEGAAPSEPALQPHAAAVQLGKTPGQSQAQASPFVVPRGRAIHLLELVKDPFLVVFGDPNTSIRHAEAYDLTGNRGLDLHQTTFRSELDGVGQQVVQNLLDLARVSRQSNSIV